ncbi:MAG: DUF4250 domain-containing protein [Lachnospiraceae bacterium]|nr:DUF4250 domain-containing protein [Lachnospiraceae bacterium]
MSIPKDPMMLLSFVNTQLRDFYPSLTEFCKSNNLDANLINEKLASIDYIYDAKLNKFI